MRKQIEQPETDRDTMWFVRADGSNLAAVIAGAKTALLDEGLAWFDQLAGLDNLLRTTQEVPMEMENTWGMGNFGSPHRVELVSSLEAAIDARRRPSP